MNANDAAPVKLSVYKDGHKWIGDLWFDDGTVWKAWQTNRTYKRLVEAARCTYDGEIN